MHEQLEQGLVRPWNRERPNQCPYCAGKIPSKKKEHIFNASWGGKAASNKLICDDCNQRFSGTIDLAFAPIVDRILNVWGMAPVRSKKIPYIDLEDGTYIGPYNVLHRKEATCDYIQEGDTYSLNFTANSKSEIKRFIDNGKLERLLEKTLTKGQKRALKSQLKFSQQAEPTISQPSMKTSVDLNAQYRSAMHTAIKAILLYTPHTLCTLDFKRAIDFVYSEVGEFRDFAVSANEFVPLHIETPTANVVSIYFSRKYGRVIACFNLLNRLTLSFTMTDYDGERDIAIVVSEGFNGNPGIFGYQTIVPRHVSPLALIEITSEPITDVEIENQFKGVFIRIQCKDKDYVYSRLTEALEN